MCVPVKGQCPSNYDFLLHFVGFTDSIVAFIYFAAKVSGVQFVLAVFEYLSETAGFCVTSRGGCQG